MDSTETAYFRHTADVLRKQQDYQRRIAGTVIYHDLQSPRGRDVKLGSREGTSDLSTLGSTWSLWGKLEDEYGLADLTLGAGDTFVDIGGHIGSVVLAVLVDNPEACGIVIEPLPENVEMIAANAEAAGVADRLTIIPQAVGPGDEVTIGYGFDGDDYLFNHRFIGNMQLGESSTRSQVTTATVTLATLLDMAGGSIAAMKLDCEGCEWSILRDPDIGKVRLIIGEWHGHSIDQRDGFAEVRSIIGKTHKVSVVSDQQGTGTFRAVRR